MNVSARDSLLWGMAFVVAIMMALSGRVYADDTDIFTTTGDSVNATVRPKVLILFDNSGSMTSNNVTSRVPYDPNTVYSGDYDDGKIYWSDDADPPTNYNDRDQWFYEDKNRCGESYDALETQGQSATTKVRFWSNSSTQRVCEFSCPAGYRPSRSYPGWCYRNNRGRLDYQRGSETCTDVEIAGSWEAPSDSVHNPDHVECEADFTNSNPDNGGVEPDGYPVDGVSDGSEYSADRDDSNVDWGRNAYTLFTANYMNWYTDEALSTVETRLEVAQRVITDFVNTNTSVDFGLGVFNTNSGSSDDGGRIVSRIIENMTVSDRSNVVNIINNLDGDTWTPLCEATYEVYRYFSGQSVFYGLEQGSTNTGYPARDTAAEDGSNYIAPEVQCDEIYLIIMTDGAPTNDGNAVSRIENLRDRDGNLYDCDDYPGNSCLPAITDYMFHSDLDGDSSNGGQHAITYTIGFDTQQALLEQAATGKRYTEDGEELPGYYEADNADTLASAFREILLAIWDTDSTFTSPAVAVDTFTRTESLDDVYYAMFKPDERVDWRGNVKKLKLEIGNDGTATIVDKFGAPAIDAETGYIADNISTYWSSTDGGAVATGGVGALLAARDPASRTILTNTGTGGALETFSAANLSADAVGAADDAGLYSYFGVNNAADFAYALAYGRGFKIEGGVVTGDPRSWIVGDILHSQPVVVNYGGADPNNPDLRIVVGTNAGFVHMFDDADGQEDWAFFPKELAPILHKRRINDNSINRVYGMDLRPALYRKDVNGDGTLSDVDGDIAWIFLGMRRGGEQIYALDISNPDSPSFMWMKSPEDPNDDMGEMAMTFSEPVATFIPGYVDGEGEPKPVVVFGAGYDPNKDDSGIVDPDTVGRGVFIVDAETGVLVRSVTPADGSSINLQASGLEHSVPGRVSVLDSNGDGLTDRLYFGDAGGNVWRVDMGSKLPVNAGSETWYFTQLADLNNGTATGDRRFFGSPDIVRIRLDSEAVDAILLGSGDRAHPLESTVENYFYMLRDYQTGLYSTPAPSVSDCQPTDPPTPLDNRCTLPIIDPDINGNSALFDITSDSLNTGDPNEIAAARLDFIEAPGWKLRLDGYGEKSLSDSVTIRGTTTFTTYSPNDPNSVVADPNDIEVCGIRAGEGKLYFVDIYDGKRDTIQLGPVMPDTPSVHVGRDGKIRILLPPGSSSDGPSDPNDPPSCRGGVCDIGADLPAPYGNYWYREDY
ncbi:pilus assembly protein [Mangrovimicrobium sediminis]|nr:PilC/PilY family type IV pilus protein [Haliea sp. SAOS-164]